MITTITLNPAIDRTLTLDHLHPGEVNRIQAVYETIGGKGINVSNQLNSLGIKTLASGLIGRKNYDQVEKMLYDTGIDFDFVRVDGMTRTNTKVVDLKNRNTTDLNEPGFEVKEADLSKLIDKLEDFVKSSDFVVLSGSLPKGCPSEIYRILQDLFKDSVRFVLDADLQALCEGIKAGPYLIKPNLNELCEAFNVTLKNDKEIITFTRNLLHKYGITLVLVSMGEDGGLLVTKDHALRSNALKIDLKSTVGAGDSMLAGCLYGLVHNFPLQDVLRIACICGSLACSSDPGKTIAKEEVMSRWDEIRLTSID